MEGGHNQFETGKLEEVQVVCLTLSDMKRAGLRKGVLPE
jgi:hypothetical protein